MVRENTKEEGRLGLDPKNCTGFEKPCQEEGSFSEGRNESGKGIMTIE